MGKLPVKKQRKAKKKEFGAAFKTVDLGRHFNWPPGRVKGEWWRKLADEVRGWPEGRQTSWGIPFRMGKGSGARVVMFKKGSSALTINLRGTADFLCLLHEWRQLPEDLKREDPTEGLVAAEYELLYADGTKAVLPVRARFEVRMAESPGTRLPRLD